MALLAVQLLRSVTEHASMQHKMTQQEQLTKQLRKQQKELKENSGVLTNQKTNFTVSSTHFCCDSGRDVSHSASANAAGHEGQVRAAGERWIRRTRQQKSHRQCWGGLYTRPRGTYELL